MPDLFRFFSSVRTPLSFAALCTIISSGAGLADSDFSTRKKFGSPKVVLISLDGAKPDFIKKYLENGVLPRNGGLAELNLGVVARQNVTATPSLTAVGHILIATGSTAAHNDIPANTFHPTAASIGSTLSGFAAPIGGYRFSPLGPSADPTAEPLWVRLRQQGKKVVAATWPGADGADIRIGNVVVQPAVPTRVVDYAVPFGAFGGLGAVGFSLKAADFAPDSAITAELAAAGHFSYSPVLATPTPFETFSCSSAVTATCTSATTLDLKFEMRAAALDSTNDGIVNYDRLVFFEKTRGIRRGPFRKPATGPAYVEPRGRSKTFYFEGTGNKVGTAYFLSSLAADLSVVRFARYGANYIPRNTPIIAAVDDINENVGFWRPQADFRIPERLSPGFSNFPDLELEAIYRDQVETFVEYQTKLAERAIEQVPDADLVMVYIEQPDGSSHQYLLTDPRQASNPLDPDSIGSGQDEAKVARYKSYVEFAYRQADRAVAKISAAAGPASNIIVVSDHGFAPFHTAVDLTNLLRGAGIDTNKLAIRSSGSAVNIYVNLQGREPGGTVDPQSYGNLVKEVRAALAKATDPNAQFNYSSKKGRIFSKAETRPATCSKGVGFCTNDTIGQDFGDVFAQLAEGYNFDGIQNPVVVRQGDPTFEAGKTIFSVPNFYGSHGHDAELASMSATFMASGPKFRRHTIVDRVRNIDVAPTILHLLGVEPGPTVDGRILQEILRR
jgi:predicted AlkP superfamily pyrophosphatase or phosphodiesterase